MAASAATIHPTTLKFGPEAAGMSNGDELEDVFVTHLDGDSPCGDAVGSARGDVTAMGTASSNAMAASINAEWKRLKQSEDRKAPHEQVKNEHTDPQERGPHAAASLTSTSVVVRMQPRRPSSDADVFLQPSQVEELLGQNSLLLGNSNTDAKTKNGSSLYSPTAQTLHRTVSNSSSTATSSLQLEDPAPQPNPPPLSPPNSRRGSSLWDGFMSCLGPVVGMVKKEKHPSEKKDPWEIPFADIRELSFIGSGSQGAVFVGEYLKEKVAVKKVMDVAYCQEARHLRKLCHPNVVKFK